MATLLLCCMQSRPASRVGLGMVTHTRGYMPLNTHAVPCASLHPLSLAVIHQNQWMIICSASRITSRVIRSLETNGQSMQLPYCPGPHWRHGQRLHTKHGAPINLSPGNFSRRHSRLLSHCKIVHLMHAAPFTPSHKDAACMHMLACSVSWSPAALSLPRLPIKSFSLLMGCNHTSRLRAVWTPPRASSGRI